MAHRWCRRKLLLYKHLRFYQVADPDRPCYASRSATQPTTTISELTARLCPHTLRPHPTPPGWLCSDGQKLLSYLVSRIPTGHRRGCWEMQIPRRQNPVLGYSMMPDHVTIGEGNNWCRCIHERYSRCCPRSTSTSPTCASSCSQPSVRAVSQRRTGTFRRCSRTSVC